jgi:aryl-alcohol dehydrogenase-like predicted oxidoreductase
MSQAHAAEPDGGGFKAASELTGAIDEHTEFASGDFRNTLPRYADPEARKANLVFVELLHEIANRKDATPAQVALAGCSPRNRGSSRSPAPRSCSGSRRTSPPPTWS